MAIFQLKNENVEILVDSHGAELKSLKRRKNGALPAGTEYMWKADPAFWKRSAPVLFPFVGGVNHKEYRTKGSVYPMSQHGFGRDREFKLLTQTKQELWMVLTSDEETFQIYPYEFVLKLGYRLLENGVCVCWQVENPGNEEMFFSIGGHPAFNCPIQEGKKQTDYRLWLDAPEKIISTRLGSSGLATRQRDTYVLDHGYLQITETLFDQDALVIEAQQIKQVSLCLEDGMPYLTVNMEAPLFGIWSPPHKKAPFICIEPWYGRCDAEGYTGELKDREWENRMEPGAVWKADYQICI